MKTIYIDVYLLLNFTVDLLSLYFASRITKVNIKNINLILIALVGALYAVCAVLISSGLFVDIALFIVSAALTMLIMGKGISFARRIKLYICFIVLMTLIGGAVHFSYSILSRYFAYQPTSQPQNRKLLILSIIIVIAFSFIKLISTVFSRTKSEKNVTVGIKLMGRRVECDALVDSGNLLIDPIDSTPVMLINQSIADKIIPGGVPQDMNSIPMTLRHYVRIIPMMIGNTRKIRVGFLPEITEIRIKNKWERIKLIFIVEKDAVNFGGYPALVPASVLEI